MLAWFGYLSVLLSGSYLLARWAERSGRTPEWLRWALVWGFWLAAWLALVPLARLWHVARGGV